MPRITARDLALIAAFAALIAALTMPGALELPGGVPITLQTLGVMLAGAILGARNGALAVTVYVVLGLIGLPILAGATGGLGVLVGPTGGFLVGFIPGALVIGWLTQRLLPKYRLLPALAATAAGGILVVYLVGVPWFLAVTGMPLGGALGLAVLPFLPGDVIKVVVTVLVAAAVHRARPGFLAAKPWPWAARRAAAVAAVPVAAATLDAAPAAADEAGSH
ncbi:biotin transporter BioY [Agromyces seonyuensis]|uniref:Biotin transporter BioY n=1 Tax=Agromyces seonyuensis TaxID=2662446 RepID=A0A6I4P4L1_9MICO|nr:biotin transporter BioY [Agromyces seonyuensis]MWB98254.1 biotin transporter BioY [Agromyces seonyuensis]